MPSPGAERWFHTLVVVGASLGGCGGGTSKEHTGGEPMVTDGIAGRGGSGVVGPSMCAFDGQFRCDDYVSRTNCRCDPGAPSEGSQCESPFEYACVAISRECVANEICLGPQHVVGCHCDPAALRPTDCPTPEEFFCDVWAPFFAGCACQSPAVDPASCHHGYCCQSESPRFGCDCCATPIK